jgi:hypothetical protein
MTLSKLMTRQSNLWMYLFSTMGMIAWQSTQSANQNQVSTRPQKTPSPEAPRCALAEQWLSQAKDSAAHGTLPAAQHRSDRARVVCPKLKGTRDLGASSQQQTKVTQDGMKVANLQETQGNFSTYRQITNQGIHSENRQGNLPLAIESVDSYSLAIESFAQGLGFNIGQYLQQPAFSFNHNGTFPLRLFYETSSFFSGWREVRYVFDKSYVLSMG